MLTMLLHRTRLYRLLGMGPASKPNPSAKVAAPQAESPAVHEQPQVGFHPDHRQGGGGDLAQEERIGRRLA